MEPLRENWEVNLTTSQLLTNVKQMSAFHYLGQKRKANSYRESSIFTLSHWRMEVFLEMHKSIFLINILACGSLAEIFYNPYW